MKKDDVSVKKSTAWVVIVYAAILITLGSWGYIKAGSVVSLVTSLVFGILLVIAAAFMLAKLKAGRLGALFLTVFLTLVFSIRYSLTHKDIPAIMSVLSAAMLLFLLARTVCWRRT